MEYRNKDADHVEWAKSLKELYLPSLRDFVKSFYPLGPVWGAATQALVSGSTSVSAAKPRQTNAPPPPPPPSGLLFSSETAPSQPKGGMSAVFQEISSSKSVTAGMMSFYEKQIFRTDIF